MTRQERLEAAQEARYPLMRFYDNHGRWIQINNRMTLRRAMAELSDAQKAQSQAYCEEGRACGARDYARAQEEVSVARRVTAEAKANAQAAFYRYTGRWPYDLYDLGLR